MALTFRERELLSRGIRPNRTGAVSLGQGHSTFGFNRGFERPLSAEQFAASDIINDALRTQADLIVSGRYDELVGKSGDGFFDAFLEDPLFAAVFELAQQEVSKIRNFRDFARQFRGAMGAAMGFLYLSALARANPDKPTPLSEEDAFEVSHALNPDAEVIIHPFGKMSLKGKYVSDGLGINRRGKVAQVIEYSSGDKKSRGLQQESGFWMVADNLGSLAYAPSFLHVAPDGVNLTGKTERMPFNVQAYYAFYRSVFSTYRASEGSSTLFELRTQWEQSAVGRQVRAGEPSQAIYPLSRS